jgi:Ser/Thr protein kinase RdoA (MazF antagonist)
VWSLDGTNPREVIVKFPVVPRELYWTRRLQNAEGTPPAVVPHLLASGTSLGSYDLAWLVLERLPFGPLGLRWHKDHIERVSRAAARFQAETADLPVEEKGQRVEDWQTLLDHSRASLRDNSIAATPAWTDAVKHVQRAHDGLVERWRARDTTHWIHGDLHLANALSRESAQSGDVILIDLAEVRPGHWTEDAVYLERQLWGRPDRLSATRPVREMARARRALGLPVRDDAHELADVRRILMAATAPAFLSTEGHPRHLAGALKQLQTALGRL